MIKECILAKTGIQFDMAYLRDVLNFDFSDLEEEMKKKEMTPEDLGEVYKEIGKYAAESRAAAQEKALSKSANGNASVTSETHSGRIGRHIHDVFDDIVDELVILWWFWWLLELVPMLTTYQDCEGNWISLRT